MKAFFSVTTKNLTWEIPAKNLVTFISWDGIKEKPSSKTYFPVGTRSKTSFLTSATAVDTQQMSKIQSGLMVKPKIIESICLINQIICEMHLILDSHI